MVSFTLRLPDALHAELKASALANFRSLHAEVLARLAYGGSDEVQARLMGSGSRLVADAQPRDIPARTFDVPRREVFPDPKVKPRPKR